MSFIEWPYPPYLAICYISSHIPFSMNCYLSLWQDYYDTEKLYLIYTKQSVEEWGTPWKVFLEHLDTLEEHGLLEYELINGSVSVLLEECIPDDFFDVYDEIENQ